MFQKTITYFSILTIVIGSMFLVSGLILAWTPPGSSPPGGNVSLPLNVSATAQTKTGALNSNSSMGAPIFYDQDNTGYYIDPASVSKFNTIDLGGVSRNTWPTGGGAESDTLQSVTDRGHSTSRWIITPMVYDRDNTAYYVDPASTSRLNYGVYDKLYSYGNVYGKVFYDADSTAYYVDPASTSKFNAVTVTGQIDGSHGQKSCYWKYTDRCGHSCGNTVFTAVCSPGYYVAGFGITTFSSYGRYDTRIYCCKF
jgi:hypothetical protein